jgi:hypothetical protein
MLAGFQFALAFGKRADAEVQNTVWFKSLTGWQKYLVASSLNFLHHWYVVILAYYLPGFMPEPYLTPVQWLLIGIFWDDVHDYNNLVRRYQKSLKTLQDLFKAP